MEEENVVYKRAEAEKYNINFTALKDKFKKENFKSMPMMKHEFLYSCINPLNENYILCLEKNIYPRDTQLFNLYHVEPSGQAKVLKKKSTILGDDDMEDSIQEDKEKDKRQHQGAVAQRLGQGLGRGIIGEGPESLTLPLPADFPVLGRAAASTKGAPIQEVDIILEIKKDVEVANKVNINDLIKEENLKFEFQEERLLKDFKETTKSGQYKYAISKWKINGGRHALQVKEFGFNGCPVNNQFSLSQDGEYMYFIQSQDDRKQSLRRVTIVNVQTFQIFREFNLDSSINLYTTLLRETALWEYNGTQFLMIYDYNEICFINTKTKKQEWAFRNKFLDEDVDESKVKKDLHNEEDDDNKQEEAIEYDEEGVEIKKVAQVKEYYQMIQNVVFKQAPKRDKNQPADANDNENNDKVYIITEKYAYGQVCIYQVKFMEDISSDTFNNQKNNKSMIISFDDIPLKETSSYCVNSLLNQFIFRGEYGIIIDNYSIDYKVVKRYKNENAYISIQKNPFLSENIMFTYSNGQDDFYGGLISSNELTKFKLNGLCQEETQTQYDYEDHTFVNGLHTALSDVRMKKDRQIVAVGMPEGGGANIVVNYIENSDKYTDQDINITFIQEISELKCNYPQVFFCKGNKELFIQSLNEKKKNIRLVLDDVFICFLELTPQFMIGSEEDKHYLKDNESVSFLTQSGDKIFINILQYCPNETQHTFKLLKTKTFIKRSDIKYGSIIKAVLMQAERKEFQNDFVLVLQYRNQIIMKSFLSQKYAEAIDKQTMVNVPMIFCPKYGTGPDRLPYEANDSIFFLQRDGLTIKMQRLLYSQKNAKQNFTTYFDHKAATIHFFTKHANLFYLMDESMQVKVMSIDEAQKKARNEQIMDFSKEAKDNWQLADFENFSLTKNTFFVRNMLHFTHSSENISKDYEQFSQSEEFLSQIIRNGPIKLENANSIMYVVEGDPSPDDEEEAKEQEDIDEDANEEDIVADGENKEEENKDKKNEESKEDILTCNFSGEFADERNGTETEKKIQEMNRELQIVGIPQENDDSEKVKIYDDKEHSHISILFIPFLDNNQIPLIYQNKNPNAQSGQIMADQIQISSFVNQNENILIVYQDQYKILSRSGEFLGHVMFRQQFAQKSYKYTEMKWIYMSNVNNKSGDKTEPFFLFFQVEKKEYSVYRLVDEGDKFHFQHCSSTAALDEMQDTQSYFNQVTVDDMGQVLQCRYNSIEERTKFEIIDDISANVQIFADIYKAFSILREMNITNTVPKGFGYAFVGDYLFIKKEQKLEYLKIYENNQPSLKKIKGRLVKATELNLQLDEHAEIVRIIGTEKQTPVRDKTGSYISHPDLVQIAFIDQSDEYSACTLYVTTWNLQLNIEHSMLQIKGVNKAHCHHFICKGVNEKMNYYINDTSFYDMQFMLPMTFLKTSSKENYDLMKISINEHKVSKDKSLYLGLGVLSNIHTGYTYRDLHYWEQFSKHKIDDITPSMIILEHFCPRYDESSIFSKYATDQKFLKLIFDEIKKFDSDEAENPWKNLFFHIIYPNLDTESPFDIAMADQSLKSIELMIQMFIELDSFSISLFIKKHFSQLFDMGLDVFENYLDICTFTNISMREMKSIKWSSNADEIFVDYHCSYIKHDFLNKISKKNIKNLKNPPLPIVFESDKTPLVKKVTLQENQSGEDVPDQGRLLSQVDQPSEREVIINKKTGEIPEIMLYNPLIKSKAEEDPKKSKMKKVEVCALEFDWIFHGDDSDQFIQRLAKTENDDLFTINSVRIIVSFMWARYFKRILYIIFIPFMIYILFFCVYVTYIYEMKVMNPESAKWQGLDIAFIVVILIILSFFCILEGNQILQLRFTYFTEVWNWLDISSNILNIAFIACDLSEVDPIVCRPLGAMAVALIWIKLFYFLRLFSPTSNMIRMIFECCHDMGAFGFVLALAMIAWGNVFFILDVNAFNQQIAQLDPSSASYVEPSHFLGQGNFLISIIYSFNMGLGNFSTNYEGLENESYLWILFLLEAIFLQIILLNLLISIMGDTFGRVTSVKEQSKLKEQCQMICENYFLLRKERVYKNSKYIIVVKLEKAGSSSSASWEGQVAKLKTAFSQMINDSKRETKLMIDGLKQEMVASYKGMDQKITENQNMSSKNTQSVDKLLKEFKSHSENMSQSSRQMSQSQNDTNQSLYEMQQSIQMLIKQVQPKQEEADK